MLLKTDVLARNFKKSQNNTCSMARHRFQPLCYDMFILEDCMRVVVYFEEKRMAVKFRLNYLPSTPLYYINFPGGKASNVYLAMASRGLFGGKGVSLSFPLKYLNFMKCSNGETCL